MVITMCAGFLGYQMYSNAHEKKQEDNLVMRYIMYLFEQEENREASEEEAIARAIAQYRADQEKAFKTDPRFSPNTSVGRFIRAVYQNAPPRMQAGDRRLVLIVDRDDVATSSYINLMVEGRGRNNERLQGPLMVFYENESGVDAGGLRRDWVCSFGRTFVEGGGAGAVLDQEDDLAEPLLVTYSETDQRYIIPRGGFNRRASIGSAGSWYLVFGRFLGLAVRELITVGIQLHPSVLFGLVGKTPTLADVEEFDPELFKRLNEIREYEDPSALMLSFVVSVEELRKVNGEWIVERRDIELVPNGNNVDVTRDNVDEYIRLLIEEKYVNGVKREYTYLQAGFLDTVPPNAIQYFRELDPGEVAKEIGGVQDLDLTDWQQHTRYEPPLSDTHQLIRWFWPP